MTFAESVEQESIFGIKNPDKELAKATLEELVWHQFSQGSQYSFRRSKTAFGCGGEHDLPEGPFDV